MADDYDADTTGDFDETTLDGAEGLDGVFLSGDGENYVMDPPDHWRGADPHDTLQKRLAEENPDFGADAEEDDYDPEMRFGDIDGHDPFEFGTNRRPQDPDHSRRLGWTNN